MAKCLRCNVTVNDVTDICPLCHGALYTEDRSQQENKYPRARRRSKMLLAKTMITAIVVLACVLIVQIDFTFFEGFIWFPIPCAGIIYAWLIFRYGVMAGDSHQAKIIVLLTFGVLFTIVIDYMTGFNRWSVNYVIPSGILTADLAMIVSMIVNRKNRQSYVVPMLIIILISLMPEVLWWFGIITKPMLSWIAMIVTISVGFASMLVNEYRSFNEIRRRFHINRK